MIDRRLVCGFTAMCLLLTSEAEAQDWWSDQPIDPSAHQNRVRAAYSDDGRYFTEEDIPTFAIKRPVSAIISNIAIVDYLTYSGFVVYHSHCQACHGSNGDGGSTAPRIKNSAVNLNYWDFYDVIVNGRQIIGNSVMPSFGDNLNVMCYLNDIYVYLKARGMNAIPPGAPVRYEPKSMAFSEDEKRCFGR